jgi:hypothetical protein
MLTSGNPIRRQDPPVTMTIALPHRLHGVFVEGAKKASMPIGMFVVQMIEAAWAERCGFGEAAPLPIAETRSSDEGEKERLKERIASLEKQIDRHTWNPADHRYWEGRYRDEAAENARLKDELEAARLPPLHIRDHGDIRLVVQPFAINETPAKEITPPARKLAPVEVRSIKGLLAAGMNTREITKDYGYTAAQIAAARGQS